MIILRAENLVKRLGGAVVLDVDTFSAKEGHVVAIVGGNGAGKSTLLRCLSLLDFPDEGVITLKARNYHFPAAPGFDPYHERIWPSISFGFQQGRLWPHLTLKQNIVLVASDSDDRRELSASALMERFGLVALADRYPYELSGGEQQRAVIARTLATKPSILLLDEPTSALDLQHIGLIRREVRDLAASGITVIVVTHQLGFAKRIADYIYLLQQGKIVCRGDVSIIDDPPNEAMRQWVAYA